MAATTRRGEHRGSSVLDIRPLAVPVTAAEIAADRAARGLPPLHDSRGLRAAVVVIGVVGCAAVGWLIALEVVGLIDPGPGVSRTAALVVVTLVAAAAFFLFAWSIYRRRQREPIEGPGLRLARFIAANGLLRDGAAPPAVGLLSEFGYRRRVTQSILGGTELPFEVASIDCVQRVRDTDVISDFTYLVVPLNRPMPHMLLDSRSNDSITSSIPAVVAKGQLLSLEGDFDRHFQLYCPRDYERNALYLFTPDLMSALIDHAADFDVEIVDQRAYFFTNRTLDLTSAEVWSAFDAILASVAPKIARVATRYSDTRDASADDGVLGGDSAGLARIARSGRRLTTRRRVPPWAYAVGVPVVLAACLVAAQKLGEIFG